MSVFCEARWRAVAALSVGAAALALVTSLTTPDATDHAWALVIAVVAAAVVRAAGSGGVRSILCLAGAMVVAQPAMHLAVEFTHSHDLLADHTTVAGLVLVAFHVALFVVLTSVVAAGDMAGRAFMARFRRLVRIVLRSLLSVEYAALRFAVEPPVSRRMQRLGACLLNRRGPPVPCVVLP